MILWQTIQETMYQVSLQFLEFCIGAITKNILVSFSWTQCRESGESLELWLILCADEATEYGYSSLQPVAVYQEIPAGSEYLELLPSPASTPTSTYQPVDPEAAAVSRRGLLKP